MKEVALIFPHQLFRQSPLLELDVPFYIIEEWLFFQQYRFHKHKLVFHRASMKFYAKFLEEQGKEVIYVNSTDANSDIRQLIKHFTEQDLERIHVIDVVDNWLDKRMQHAAKSIEIKDHDSPGFINSREDLKPYFRKDKKRFFQTKFYKNERQRLNLLMNSGEPEGGSWTYDKENREKYPSDKTPPEVNFPDLNDYYEEAITYVNSNFSKNYGEIQTDIIRYPTTFKEADQWFDQFLVKRFNDFGPYEDAIVTQEHLLHHSLLSPLINVGLLEPMAVVKKAIEYAKDHDVPINSLEGFVRQIIGWREFIRGMYIAKGIEARTTNHWNAKRKLPETFYLGTTGIPPIDNTIKKINKTAYAHHIERLMVMGNFMLLCEFDPDDVYQWFMELFIDAYDWVMVPNVYSMSLYADGGIFATKPYISSSNYLMKMSDFKKGEWQKIWDGLFWRFMDKHRDVMSKNPRLKMLLSTFDKMSSDKQEAHLNHAQNFLDELDEMTSSVD